MRKRGSIIKDESATGGMLNSITQGKSWEAVEDKKVSTVWVLRSKNKFMVRAGKALKHGDGWCRKPEYAHMYYRGLMAGGREKEASCLLSEAKVYDMPLPEGRYNSEVWEFVRCRLVEEAVEDPVESYEEALIKFNK